MDERQVILEEALICIGEAERIETDGATAIIARRFERWGAILARGVDPYEAAMDAALYIFSMARLMKGRGVL